MPGLSGIREPGMRMDSALAGRLGQWIRTKAKAMNGTSGAGSGSVPDAGDGIEAGGLEMLDGCPRVGCSTRRRSNGGAGASSIPIHAGRGRGGVRVSAEAETEIEADRTPMEEGPKVPPWMRELPLGVEVKIGRSWGTAK